MTRGLATPAPLFETCVSDLGCVCMCFSSLLSIDLTFHNSGLASSGTTPGS